MHPAMIKAHLAMKGTSQAQIARDLGVSEAQISYAINGKPGYLTTRKIIAEILGMSPSDLWPSSDPAQSA